MKSGQRLFAIGWPFRSEVPLEHERQVVRSCHGVRQALCVKQRDAADLGEHNLGDMVRCIRLCMDCADICTTAAGVTSRLVDYDPAVLRPLLESCAAICRSCGDECERHAAMHAHCRVCAPACRRCEQACQELLGALP